MFQNRPRLRTSNAPAVRMRHRNPSSFGLVGVTGPGGMREDRASMGVGMAAGRRLRISAGTASRTARSGIRGAY